MIDPLAIARTIHLAATTLAAGMMFFELAIARPFVPANTLWFLYYTEKLKQSAWIVLVTAAISGLGWALLVAMSLSDGSAIQAISDGTLVTLLTQTRFGQVWLWRELLFLLAALSLLSSDPRIAWCRLIAVAAPLAMIGCVGHSAARPDAVGWAQLGADMAHLLAAGLWLGSLPALAFLLSGRGHLNIGAATRRFSSFGAAAVVTLLLTGIFNAYLLTDSIWALPYSQYGQLLLLKSSLFAVMVAFAAINRWHWTSRLPKRRAVATIRRHSLIEATLGLAVLAVVGVLGTLPPPRHAHAGSQSDEGAFVHIHDLRGMAEVRLIPGTPGQNDAEVRLMQEDFSPLIAKSVVLRLSQPDQPAVTADAAPAGDGLWRVSRLALPASGTWTVLVEIERSGKPPLPLDGPIVVDPGSPSKSE